MRREPFIVQTWSDEAGALVPAETLSFETADQASRLATFAARRRAGVLVYRTPDDGRHDRIVIASLGRVPFGRPN